MVMTNVTQSHAQLTSSLLQLHLYEEHHRVETCNLPLILAQRCTVDQESQYDYYLGGVISSYGDEVSIT